MAWAVVWPIGTDASAPAVTAGYTVASTGCTLVAAAGCAAKAIPPDVGAPPLGIAATGTGVPVGTQAPRGGLSGWN